MDQIPHDEDSISEIFLQEEEKSDTIRNTQKTYETIESLPSSSSDEDEDDEVDTQDSGFSSALSFEDQNDPVKVVPSASTVSSEFQGAKAIRTPTLFTPRSPKNYNKKPLRKSRSAESILSSPNKHYEPRGSSPPLTLSESQSNDAFDSPKYPFKSDLMVNESQRTMSTDGTFQFPSPFSTPHSSMNFGDFGALDSRTTTTTTNNNTDEETTGRSRSIRRISEGDADGTDFAFQQSMDLGDVFPSVFDDTPFGPSKSLPEIQSPGPFGSSLNGHSANGSRGSNFEQAMEIDPFDDNCVQFERDDESNSPIHPPDLVAQMQALRKEHKEEVNALKREIETGNKIITSLTKQVQELMARNEKLSVQNKKATREAKRQYQQQKAARIDMMGHVIESPDASPSIQRHKTVVEVSDIESAELLSDGETGKNNKKHHHGKEKSKRKSHANKRKSRKATRTSTGDSNSTHETMILNDTDQATKRRSSKGTGTTTTTRKKRKSKRNAKPLSFSSIEADEHPLSQAKRQKSMEAKSLRHSIAAIQMENGNNTNSSKPSNNNKRMSEIESIWAFDWKDPAKAESKRDSQKKKHNSKKHLAQLKENLEASVGKLPKRTKTKRKAAAPKCTKAKQAANETTQQEVTINPLTSPIQKAKRLSRKSFAAVGRLLSPNAQKRRKPNVDDTRMPQVIEL